MTEEELAELVAETAGRLQEIVRILERVQVEQVPLPPVILKKMREHEALVQTFKWVAGRNAELAAEARIQYKEYYAHSHPVPLITPFGKGDALVENLTGRLEDAFETLRTACLRCDALRDACKVEDVDFDWRLQFD
jgi:hypothetical protein